LFRAKRRTVVTVTAVVAVLLAGALTVTLLTQGGSSPGKIVDGNTIAYTAGHQPMAPDVSGKSLTGSVIKLSAYRGKVVVLNFWGSWCPPCRSEAETLEVAAQQYSSQGVDFLGDDLQDNTASALAFTTSHHISYPSFNDSSAVIVAEFSQAAPVSDTPTTVVINRTGHVVGMETGAITNGELTKLLHEAAVTT
jgi:peroxiredoxin